MQLETNARLNHQAEAQGSGVYEVELMDLLLILARRSRFIVLFTGGITALFAVIIFFIPNQYTATSVIMPPAQGSSGTAILSQLSGSGGLAAAAGSSLGLKSPGEMYLSLLRCRTVEDAVIKRFGLMKRYSSATSSDARADLEGRSKAVYGAKDGLITISVTDRDPRQAAVIANGYVEEFQKFSSTMAITEAAQRRLFFQQQLLDAKGQLTAAEEALKGTQQSTGVLQIDSQTRALIESAAQLRAQVAAKEVQVQSMHVYASEDNPGLLQAKQQLAALQAQLAKLTGTDQNSGLIVPKGKVSEVGLEYERKLRDVKYYETISELIAKQYEMAKLDEARQGAAIQIVDIAVPPDKKSYPRRKIIDFAVFLLGLVIACGWCFGAEVMRRTNSIPGDIDRINVLRRTFFEGLIH